MKTALARFDLSLNLRYNALVIRAFATVWLVISLAVILNSATVFGQTTEADVYVAQAVLDLDEKRYDAALENLRRALELEPDHVEALYFTGAVYAAQAAQGLRLAPGSQLTGPAERLRDTIVASRDKERRFSLEARVGLTWDDNVIVRPVENFDEPLVAEIRRHKHESYGELAGLNLTYVWWRTVDWESSIGYSFFTTYQNDVPKFGVISSLGTARLTYKPAVAQLPAQVSLQYAFDHMLLGGDEFLQRHTVSLSGVVIESARNFTQGFVRFQAKDFADVDQTQRIINDNRSGNNYMAGFLHFVRFAEDRHYFKVGYQFDWDDTGNDDGRNWMYYGNRLSFGGQYTLPWWAILLKYDLDAHLRDYTYKKTVLTTYSART